jgi:transcriptional regulator with XRE-family HTH domain
MWGMTSLGETIQRLRMIRGFTQEKLAERVGVSTNYIGYIEQGKKDPRIKILRKIADVLGVQVKDLFPF